jgi:putative FmdB family regulatory protein
VPVYEYRCKKGHEYELTESFSAPSEQKCVKCGATAKRQISMPAVIFKGSGFYSTDSRKSSGVSSESDSAPSASTTSPSDNGHGHSHGPGSHTHGSSSDTKAEAPA